MTHADLETMSAYLDSELSEDESTRFEIHLSECAQCQGHLESLRKAAYAVASLPPLSPNPDESRRIFEAVGAHLGKSRLRLSSGRVFALLGSAAVLVVAALVAPRLINAPRVAQQTSAAALNLDSPQDVREAVSSDSSIIERLGDYDVADVGTEQEQLIGLVSGERRMALAKTQPQTTTGARADSTEEYSDSGSPAQEPAAAPPPRYTQSAVSLSSCIRTVLQSQPYPMLPLSARPATYKTEPAWLLVYAFTIEKTEDAKLDRIQIWVVRRTDCSTLHYAFFKP